MRKDVNGILIFVGILWVVFGLDFVLSGELRSFGVTPRTVEGLVGILLMPLLHGSVSHLLNNTIPLVVLLMMLFSSRSHPVRIIVCLVILSGGLLWLFGSNATHVGASGLIYALIAFLIMAGVLERRMVPLGISILVGCLYGGTLLWGVFPNSEAHVSWDGHLLGAVAGGLFAWGTIKRKPKIRKVPVQPEPTLT